MIEFIEGFDLVQFMEVHGLSIRVGIRKDKYGYKCFLVHRDTPVLHGKYAVRVYSKHRNEKDVLDIMAEELIETVVIINGKKVLVI